MMKNKEKGFALILSLVLLLVMSLMGGSLIVISAVDHQSNNTSDTYQQSFFVAETALLEGEKYVINQYLGPRPPLSSVRDRNKKNLPKNSLDADSNSDCYKSFPGLPTSGLKVVIHSVNISAADGEYDGDANRVFNFANLFDNIFTSTTASEIFNTEDPDIIANEKNYLGRFEYEYIIEKLGPAPFRGFGQSIKKGSIDTGADGIAYRVYGCGIYTKSPEIIVPLESSVVLPN